MNKNLNPTITQRRRIACHQLVLPTGKSLTLQVVEIRGGLVENYYSFTEELPRTEWLPGCVKLNDDGDGLVRAYYEGKLIA